MADIISSRHSNTILLYLLSRGKIKKTDLLQVISSSDSLSKSLREMEEEGLIRVSTQIIGRKVIFIELTEKGRLVAEELKKADEIAKSTTLEIIEKDHKQENEEEKIDLSLTDEEIEKSKNLHLLFHVNVMDDHVTVEEVVPGKTSRIFNIYIKRNGNGDFRLWCEQDQSYDCWHVKAAWTYPHVQKMMMHYKEKAKVCVNCHESNDADAIFCKHCGVRLE